MFSSTGLGTLPENPILVEFREEWRWVGNVQAFLAEWLVWVTDPAEIARIWPDAKPGETEFTARVLSLLAAVTR